MAENQYAENAELEKFLLALQSKTITPLMDDWDINIAAQQIAAAEQRHLPEIPRLIDNYLARLNLLTLDQREKVIPRLVYFFIARYNDLPEQCFLTLIPEIYPPRTKEFNDRAILIMDIGVECEQASLGFLVSAVALIIKSAPGGNDFLSSLHHTERRRIFKAVYDQYPLWLVMKFKREEAQYVDFGQMLVGDGPMRANYRAWFRGMFAYMAEVLYVGKFRVGAQHKNFVDMVKDAWRDHAPGGDYWQDRIGNQYDMPGLVDAKPLVGQKAVVQHHTGGINSGRDVLGGTTSGIRKTTPRKPSVSSASSYSHGRTGSIQGIMGGVAGSGLKGKSTTNAATSMTTAASYATVSNTTPGYAVGYSTVHNTNMASNNPHQSIYTPIQNSQLHGSHSRLSTPTVQGSDAGNWSSLQGNSSRSGTNGYQMSDFSSGSMNASAGNPSDEGSLSAGVGDMSTTGGNTDEKDSSGTGSASASGAPKYYSQTSPNFWRAGYNPSTGQYRPKE